jgi:hypothetical protein
LHCTSLLDEKESRAGWVSGLACWTRDKVKVLLGQYEFTAGCDSQCVTITIVENVQGIATLHELVAVEDPDGSFIRVLFWLVDII